MDVVRFGVFQADFRTGELRKQGVQVRLQDKPLQLLAALVERPGELVSRDALRQRLWGDQTFVDFERSLNIATTKLRAALGDSADSPRFIETLPRRGYRYPRPSASRHPTLRLPSPSRSFRQER
jgi:DNA-binding winged helix-turn-helix (wHTH) protein